MRRLLEKNKFQIKDEYYTPSILVEPILPYLPKDKIIWCPFDTQNSEFVLLLREKGYNVIQSHINGYHNVLNRNAITLTKTPIQWGRPKNP